MKNYLGSGTTEIVATAHVRTLAVTIQIRGAWAVEFFHSPEGSGMYMHSKCSGSGFLHKGF